MPYCITEENIWRSGIRPIQFSARQFVS